MNFLEGKRKGPFSFDADDVEANCINFYCFFLQLKKRNKSVGVNIYILIDWFLPAYRAGGPIQSISNLISQPEEGIKYNIVCSNKDLNGTKIQVKTDEWLWLNTWTRIYYSSKGMNKHLLGNKNDILFINGIYSWHYNIRPILFSKAARKIVSARGMLHAEAISQKAFKKNIFLRLWKLVGIHRKVEFHASSKIEEKAIKTVFGENVKVHLAANFPRVFEKQPVISKRRGELNLVSVALISPMKNILLVLQALKSVEEKVHYHIYGPVKEAAYWQECLALIKTLPQNIQVHYHGDVHPSKVEEALSRGHVFVLPSKSENFAHAIYEALTAGKPVITSQNTPWNGLHEAKAGQNVSVVETGGLTAAIQAFAAMDQQELTEWSEGAKAYAEAAIDLEEIRKQYRAMFGVQEPKKKPGKQMIKNEK